ncbi:DNA maturase B [Megasphaera sp. SW808]|uniref:phage terminase large subunit n=1 Tax=Megasphaera sp. SW808 TaxID=2530045 RepID=UPI00143C325D|nr:phage terminase large subunit [Megasphaera sp. SW808]NJE35211.1 DNA maturase B [Megasphaera sp. SW808]
MKRKEWSQSDIKNAYENFWAFVYIVWHEIGLPAPTPVQLDIANYLQHPPTDRIIIEGFRGVAKSFLTCAFVVWTLWKQRQDKVLIVSASGDRADANARFIKRIIQTIDFLAEMKASKNQLDTQNIFDVGGAVPDISPSVKSIGITGQITGTRADLLIADDVEIPKNSATQAQRDKLSEAVKEFDAILKPGGQIIYLGTPQTESSLYNTLQDRGYKARVWPVRYPPLEECEDHYQDTLAPFIYDKLKANPALAGQPTDPQRFDELEITKRELSYGKAGFALQFMLNTRLSDAEKYPLKVADLIVTPLDLYETSVKWAWANGRDQLIKDIPCTALTGDFFYAELSRSAETLPYDYTIMAIDPSGRGKDETSYAVLKYLNGYLFLMDVGGFKEGYSDIVLTQLANRAKFWNVDLIVPEDNYGDGMFTKLMTPVFTKIHPCGIEPVKNRGQKELRIIDTLEPVMMRHKLIVNRPVIEADYKVFQQDYNYSLIYQMTRLCRDKGALAHDDRLEAVAIGVAHFLENMDINESEKITEISEEELDRWMNVSVIDKYAKDDTRYARLESLKR